MQRLSNFTSVQSNTENTAIRLQHPFTARNPVRSIATSLCAAGLILGLVGCSSTPTYAPPQTRTPVTFKESAVYAHIFGAAQMAEIRLSDAWWELFQDPVLNSLQKQVANIGANQGNQTLAASAAAVLTARAAVDSSQAALWPTLGVSAGATRSGTSAYQSGTSGFAAQVTVPNWEIDIWNRLGAGVSAADARLQASAADLAMAELSIRATIVQTYLSMRAAEAQAAVLERNLKDLNLSLQLTQNRYAAGVVASVDVAQAQSQLKSAQTQALELALQRAQLEHALASLLGLATSELSIPITAMLPSTPTVPLQLPSQLLERRPDIAAAERRVAAANAQIGAAKAAFFPALTLSGSLGFKNTILKNLFNLPNLLWSIGPNLAASIFDAGARAAATDAARANYDQAVAVYRQTVLLALQEVDDNLISASKLTEEEAIQKELLQAARKTLEVNNNQYKAGIVSYLNVITAQSSALSAETNLISVQNRRLAALNTLLKNIAGRAAEPVKNLSTEQAVVH